MSEDFFFLVYNFHFTKGMQINKNKNVYNCKSLKILRVLRYGLGNKKTVDHGYLAHGLIQFIFFFLLKPSLVELRWNPVFVFEFWKSYKYLLFEAAVPEIPLFFTLKNSSSDMTWVVVTLYTFKCYYSHFTYIISLTVPN